MNIPTHDPARRTFLKTVSALGSAALLPAIRSDAQSTAGSKPFRIDTHSHFTVPSLRAEVTKAGQQPLLAWNPQKSIDEMERGRRGDLHSVGGRSRRVVRR